VGCRAAVWLYAAAGVLLFTVSACAQTPVILISIDTLRADHLSAYGYTKAHTPAMDSFAHQGTVFESIDSQLPLTLPSHTVLFTSTYPFESRIEENDQHVPQGVVTLASVLRSRGYKTAAFVGSVLMDRHQGLDQGFDFYDSPFSVSYSGEPRNPFNIGVRRDGALVLRAARQWLSENRNQPVFAFLHFFDLHAPYTHASSADGLPNTAGYDAEIAYIDRLLGQFQQFLQQSGWWDRALVVLLSDHGESLGEHGETSHGYFMYQSTLHVPLIFHWPAGARNYPARASQPGGLIDVAPSILAFLKLPVPSSFEGANLLAGNDPRRAVYGESVYTRDAFHWAPLRGIRAGGFQYIDAPEPELYDLEHDPGEHHNAVRENAAMAQTLRGQLAALMAQHTPRRPAPLSDSSPQSRRALESLGYVGHGSKTGDTSADPKERLAEYNLYEKALSAMYSGREPDAVAAFRQVLVRDPHNSLARYYLGDAFLRERQPDSAIREWTNALKFDPEYTPAAEALGAWWMGKEDYPKARAAFQKALAAAPDDFTALLEIGIAEEHLGLLADALAHLKSACKLAPDSVQCGRELQAVQQKMK